jgi:hypothetical protein
MELLKLGMTEDDLNPNKPQRRRSITKRHTSFSVAGGISPRNFANAARRFSKLAFPSMGAPTPTAAGGGGDEQMRQIKISFGGGFT